MEIKILGTGCKKCKELTALVQSLIEELGIDNVQIVKIEDAAEIADHGILMTPGLVINGKTKVSGRLPKKDQIKKWIEAEK